MTQQPLPLFEVESIAPMVNVASVPQYSPFRYPGGKTWLIPKIRQWLKDLTALPSEFIEPFAGGGIVSLTAAFEKLAQHIVMVERDEQVGAVWRSIIEDGQAEWLAQEILTFPMTADSVDCVLSTPAYSTAMLAFQTIIRNRVNRGGILAPGAGRLKSGENGKGIRSRWYPKTLAQRILAIAHISDRLSFYQDDGLRIIEQYLERRDVAYFVDPPYTAAGAKPGTRLYAHNEINHPALFEMMAKAEGAFLMTYQDDGLIHDLATQYGFCIKRLFMKTTHHTKKTELLISRDLSWVDDPNLE